MKTKFIAHRINTIYELKKLPSEFGVELDLRDSQNGRVHIAHDPFVLGEDFEEYLRAYHHGLMILNVKSERIEFEVLKLLQKYEIKEYFFLDCSFPMIYTLYNRSEQNIALRFSEFEGMDTIRNMAGRVKWIWVDCFSKIPVDGHIMQEFQNLGYKTCLVSPELQGRQEDLQIYKKFLQNEQIEFDLICTKYHNIKEWK